MIEPSKQLQGIFDSAIEVTKTKGHKYLTIEHLLLAIVSDKDSADGLKAYGADVDYIKHNIDHYLKENLKTLETLAEGAVPKKTHAVERVLNRCFTQVLFSGRNQMEVADVIISILGEKNSCILLFNKGRNY